MFTTLGLTGARQVGVLTKASPSHDRKELDDRHHNDDANGHERECRDDLVVMDQRVILLARVKLGFIASDLLETTRKAIQ